MTAASADADGNGKVLIANKAVEHVNALLPLAILSSLKPPKMILLKLKDVVITSWQSIE